MTRLRSARGENGYWLPVNADAPPKDTFWVPNEQITGHLGRLIAKRVLVVADSCYAGLLSTDPSYLFLNDKVAYSKDYIKYKLPKRARLLLSSGGDKPVLDEGSGGNSVFARAFLDALESNTGIMSTPELFTRISKRVEIAAAKNKFVQKPEFKSIKGAGHEVGRFFLRAEIAEDAVLCSSVGSGRLTVDGQNGGDGRAFLVTSRSIVTLPDPFRHGSFCTVNVNGHRVDGQAGQRSASPAQSPTRAPRCLDTTFSPRPYAHRRLGHRRCGDKLLQESRPTETAKTR